MKKNIVITGGNGRFGSVLKKINNKKNLFFPTKKELNILKLNSIKSYLKIKKPRALIHLAGLSRPMDIHDKNINKSIDLNIIGTANIVKICSFLDIKLIYFSTHYVYPCNKGNYSEDSPLLPINNYAWSKLGGESAVQMYKNSLILRVCMTENPFVHKSAFANVKSNFIFHEDVAKILFKLIKKKGIIYNFAKKNNPEIKKVYLKKKSRIQFPKNPSINIGKLKKLIKF